LFGDRNVPKISLKGVRVEKWKNHFIKTSKLQKPMLREEFTITLEYHQLGVFERNNSLNPY